MKKLRLHELTLVSHLERAARSIKFDPKTTVLLGPNDVGKSSLLKSIYHALGAEPAMINKRWKSANVISCLKFEIEGIRYTILRDGPIFCLFDSDDKLILKTNKVTSELGPVIAPLLDFQLVLTSKQDKAITPPPAFCFLPFYADQDKGWTQSWQSFGNLGQFKNWRQAVIHYHCGIRPKEYYDIKGCSEAKKIEQSDIFIEQKATQITFEKIKESTSYSSVNFDPKQLEGQTAALMIESDILYNTQHAARQNLSELVSRRSDLKDQLDIAKSALSEFEKDYTFLKEQTDNEIQCPTCGTYHGNSFLNRFSLIDDKERCREFLKETKGEIEKIEKEINIESKKLGTADTHILKIQNLLEEKHEKLSLQDIIESASQQRIEEIMQQRLAELKNDIEKIDVEIAEYTRKLKDFDDKKRRKEIETFYMEHMVNHLIQLNVKNITYKEIQKIDCSIKSTGSDQPRAVLAYIFAYLKTLIKFSTSCLAPIVIDAPLQQEPDDENRKRIVDFIFSEQPEDTQMIVGIIGLFGATPKGTVIELKEEHKHSVLRPEFYEEISVQIRHYENALV